MIIIIIIISSSSIRGFILYIIMIIIGLNNLIRLNYNYHQADDRNPTKYLPLLNPSQSCLWSFFCMEFITWDLCFKLSAWGNKTNERKDIRQESVWCKTGLCGHVFCKGSNKSWCVFLLYSKKSFKPHNFSARHFWSVLLNSEALLCIVCGGNSIKVTCTEFWVFLILCLTATSFTADMNTASIASFAGHLIILSSGNLYRNQMTH